MNHSAFERWYASQPHVEWSAKLAAKAAWDEAVDIAAIRAELQGSDASATAIRTLKTVK